MNQRPISIDKELQTLQIIVYAITFSLVIYVAVAMILLHRGAIEPTTIPDILPPVLAAVGVSILASTRTVVKTMMARVRTVHTPAEKLAAYRVAVIVGTALRESAGIIGLVATLLTGNLLWVCLLSALAALAILTNLPTRSALNTALSESPPIG